MIFFEVLIQNNFEIIYNNPEHPKNPVQYMMFGYDSYIVSVSIDQGALEGLSNGS